MSDEFFMGLTRCSGPPAPQPQACVHPASTARQLGWSQQRSWPTYSIGQINVVRKERPLRQSSSQLPRTGKPLAWGQLCWHQYSFKAHNGLAVHAATVRLSSRLQALVHGVRNVLQSKSGGHRVCTVKQAKWLHCCTRRCLLPRVRRLTHRSTGRYTACRHLGHKFRAQMPPRRNGPVGANAKKRNFGVDPSGPVTNTKVLPPE